MENKLKDQIAIALFTGTIIALFIFIGSLAKTFIHEILIIIIFIIIIFISLKLLLEKSTDLHYVGDIVRKLLRIKN